MTHTNLSPFGHEVTTADTILSAAVIFVAILLLGLIGAFL